MSLSIAHAFMVFFADRNSQTNKELLSSPQKVIASDQEQPIQGEQMRPFSEKKTHSMVGGTFVGNWMYEPTDPVTQKNTAFAACPDSKMPRLLILKGSMSIQQTGPHSITAINENGCTLKFEVQGNTAALNPSVQTCENAPKGSPKTYNFWTMATDDKELVEFGSGSIGDEHGDCFLRATQGVRSAQ